MKIIISLNIVQVTTNLNMVLMYVLKLKNFEIKLYQNHKN